MEHVLDEQKVAVDKQGNFLVIREIMNPVRYGEKLGINLTVLESTGEFLVESESDSKVTKDIKDFTLLGEL